MEMAQSPGDQVPGIVSGIAVGLNDSTAAAGFGWCTMKEIQPSNRSVRPQCPIRFQRLDFHGVPFSISVKMQESGQD